MTIISVEKTAKCRQIKRRSTMTNLDEFLRDLTDTCRKHGIGITGEPTLFVMEPADAALEYAADAESKLTVK